MALIHMDGFDLYETERQAKEVKVPGQLRSRYNTNVSTSPATTITFKTTGGRNGGGCVEFGPSGSQDHPSKTRLEVRVASESENLDEIYVQYAFYWADNWDNDSSRYDFIQVVEHNDIPGQFESSKASPLEIQYRADTRTLIAYNDNAYRAEATNAIPDDNTWYYFEMYLKAATEANGGRLIVKIDGTTIIDSTADFDPSNGSPINDVRIFGQQGFKLDDLVIMNGSGSVNNGFLGDVSIKTLSVNEDTDQTDWIRIGGSTDFENLDDAIPGGNDATGSYVYTSSSSAVSSYFGFQTLEPGNREYFTNIYAVSMQTAVSGTTNTGQTIKQQLKVNDVETFGSGAIPSSSYAAASYTVFDEVFETRPDDVSVSWSQSSVNSIYGGVKLS